MVVSTSYAANALGTYPILIHGSDSQKKRYLPHIATGKKLVAFGLTEANAGSDASGVQTTAKLDGSEYVLNGTKQWITNGGEADIYTVIALTDRSRSAWRISRPSSWKRATRASPSARRKTRWGSAPPRRRELVFQDCRVPKSNLLGKEGMGFLVAMKTLDQSRPGVASQALGIAQGAMDQAVKYSQERRQFGKPISAFQGIQFILADMATQVEAARALTTPRRAASTPVRRTCHGCPPWRRCSPPTPR